MRAGIWVIVAASLFMTVGGHGALELQGARTTGDDTDAPVMNPHSDLVFRATGARRCADCHANDAAGRWRITDSAFVRRLVAKGKGAHGSGRFADCLRCHAGGRAGEY